MKTMDLTTWNRHEHFEFFMRMDRPQYDVCTQVDVNAFYNSVKRKGISFYYAMCFAAIETANKVEALRYRIRKDKVVLHEKLHASFTELKEGNAYFSIIECDIRAGLQEFLDDAAAKVAAHTGFINNADYDGRDDFVFMTCLPWLSFTQVTNAYNVDKNDAVPRFAWGKYERRDGKMLMPFSVQVHHAFVDGYHVGQFFMELQKTLDVF